MRSSGRPRTAGRELEDQRGRLRENEAAVTFQGWNHFSRQAEVQEAVIAAFGDEMRRPDGRIDRPALGSVVFNDPAALRELERIVHPVVGEVVYARIDASKAKPCREQKRSKYAWRERQEQNLKI